MPGCIVNSSTRTESASTTVKTMVMPDYVRSGDRLVTTAITTTPGVMMVLTLTMVAPALMTSACVTAVVGVVVSLTMVAPPLMTSACVTAAAGPVVLQRLSGAFGLLPAADRYRLTAA